MRMDFKSCIIHAVNVLLLLMLGGRIFICEQAQEKNALLFNITFYFLIFIHFIFLKKIRLDRFYLIILLPLLMIFPLYFSVNRYETIVTAVNFFLLSFVALYVFSLEKEYKKNLLWIMLIAGALVSLRAVYQWLFGFSFLENTISPQVITENGFYALDLLKHRRVVSCFSSPGLLASYLAMLLCIVCGLIFEYRERHFKKRTIYSYLLAFLFFTALILTKTISAYLSLCFVLFFLFFIFLKKRKSVWRYGKIILAMFIIAAVFAGIFFQRINFFTDLKNPENSIVQRLYYWQSAVKVIKENPLFGVGAGNFGFVYPRFKHEAANETIYAHNSYLQLWAELGIFSLLFFLFLIRCLFMRALKQRFNFLQAGMLAGTVVFLLHNFFDYSFFIFQTAFVWWVLFAFSFAHEEPEAGSEKQFERGMVLRIIFSFLIIFLLFYNIAQLYSKISLEKGIEFLKAKKYDEAIKSVNRSVWLFKKSDLNYYILAHIFLKKNGQDFSSEVIKNYKKAIALNRYYSFYYYELALYYEKHNYHKEAKEFFAKAVYFYPTNKKFQLRNN
ncbi:MAG: O-antigen ligase family protein [Candidatus Omnitrophica bacterium]|nr:O-antigen ligase family protein [Candidatus Omnitrophota bacterium]